MAAMLHARNNTILFLWDKMFILMQNIFIVPCIQHGRHAKPLYRDNSKQYLPSDHPHFGNYCTLYQTIDFFERHCLNFPLCEVVMDKCSTLKGPPLFIRWNSKMYMYTKNTFISYNGKH